MLLLLVAALLITIVLICYHCRKWRLYYLLIGVLMVLVEVLSLAIVYSRLALYVWVLRWSILEYNGDR
jgi:hypothetical protein